MSSAKGESERAAAAGFFQAASPHGVGFDLANLIEAMIEAFEQFLMKRSSGMGKRIKSPYSLAVSDDKF